MAKTGLQFDSLNDSIKGLAKLNKVYKKAAVGILREAATDMQKRSQSRIGNHPAYRGPKNKGMIGRSATSTGAGLKLRASKYPWALKGEYGERVTHVYGRPRRQQNQKRRTAAPHKPPTSDSLADNQGGYWIQPTIRKRLPHVQKQILDDFDALFAAVMRRQGVKTNGR